MREVTERQIRTREKYSKRKSTNDKILWTLFLFIFVSSIIVFKEKITKATNTTDNIISMVEPIQNEIEVTFPYKQNINGIDTVITRIAEYQISGRAVETYDYTTSVAGFVNIVAGSTHYNDISCKDVAIAYGPMALSENHKRMHYVMSGTRRIMYAIRDKSLIEDVGDLKTVGKYITNNHLIAADSRSENLIKKIEKDDYVQITGYLITISWDRGSYHYSLSSSLSRDDVGNNACEVILVEDVKWIK